MDRNTLSTHKRLKWRIVAGAAVLLTLVTFTSLVTPIGSHEPMLMGIPFTLWSGLLVSIGYVLLTFAATRYYPYDVNENDDT